MEVKAGLVVGRARADFGGVLGKPLALRTGPMSTISRFCTLGSTLVGPPGGGARGNPGLIGLQGDPNIISHPRADLLRCEGAGFHRLTRRLSCLSVTYRPGEIHLVRTRVGEAFAGELRGFPART